MNSLPIILGLVTLATALRADLPQPTRASQEYSVDGFTP